MHTSARRVTIVDLEADATRFDLFRPTGDATSQQGSKEMGLRPEATTSPLGESCGQALREVPLACTLRLCSGDQIELAAVQGPYGHGESIPSGRASRALSAHVNQKPLRQFGADVPLVGRPRARTGCSPMPDDLSGGTFTITNLGGNDVLAFTPVINLPQAAILGVGKISPALAMKDGQRCGIPEAHS